MKVIDYSKTLMYMIVCDDLSVTDKYIGSTTNFISRQTRHKFCSKDENSNSKLYEKIKNTGGWNNWSMIEIEKYPCKDGNECRARERYWFEFHKATLNNNIPYVSSRKESDRIYHQKNKEKRNAYNREYNKIHKEKYKAYQEKYRLKRLEKKSIVQNEILI